MSAQRGVSAQGGVYIEVSVCIEGGCLPGGVCPGGICPREGLAGGCLPGGDVYSQHALRQTHPSGQNS